MLAAVVAELSKTEEDVINEAVQLLDAFHTKRLHYDAPNKQFSLLDGPVELHARDPLSKVEMYRQRYALIHQRVLRNELFRKGLRSSLSNGNVISLTPVESLVGRGGSSSSGGSSRRNFFLLGMIVQMDDFHYYLEDLTSSSIRMDLSEAVLLGEGYVTEGCIVLVEGYVMDGTLHVKSIGHPPSESRNDAVNVIGYQNTDLFDAVGSYADHEQLLEQEAQCGMDSMFVILSDVYLDRNDVMLKLKIMFDAYQHFDPLPIFVFMGNFSSVPFTYANGGVKKVMGYFEELGNLIREYPSLAKDARFIFVPGPKDPGNSTPVSPRPPIPSLFSASLRQKVSHATFTSNPCRIRFFSREIVLSRNDIIHKMKKHSLFSNEKNDLDGDRGKSYAHTIVDQGHLCPLPMNYNPIYWQHDQSLRLYPLPHTIIAGDNYRQYSMEKRNCQVVNPGSFAKDWSFVVYRPVGEELTQSGRSVDSGTQQKAVLDGTIEFSRID